jgi:hypothetical protein
VRYGRISPGRKHFQALSASSDEDEGELDLLAPIHPQKSPEHEHSALSSSDEDEVACDRQPVKDTANVGASSHEQSPPKRIKTSPDGAPAAVPVGGMHALQKQHALLGSTDEDDKSDDETHAPATAISLDKAVVPVRAPAAAVTQRKLSPPDPPARAARTKATLAGASLNCPHSISRGRTTGRACI